MSLSKINWYRFCFQSSRFGIWIGFIIIDIAICGLGLLVGKIGEKMGELLPQFNRFWLYFPYVSYQLCKIGSFLLVILVCVYVVILACAKFSRIHLIRSGRLTELVHNMLTTAVDIVPSGNVDRRDKAKNVVSQLANKAVRKSFCVALNNKTFLFVFLPRQVQVRETFNGYLDEVANDLSRFTDLTSGDWEVTRGSIFLSQYKIMVFKK